MNSLRDYIALILKYTLSIALIITTQKLSANVVIDSLAVHHISCDALKGKIIIYASGADNLQYSIDGGTTYHDSNIFQNLDKNDYLIYAYDQASGDYDIKSTQLIELIDIPAPTIICPDILNVECSQPNIDLVIAEWEASCKSYDHLGNELSNKVMSNLSENSFDKCGEDFQIQFETNDPCGTLSSCYTNITVVDNKAPLTRCPNMLEIDLEDTSWPDVVENWLEEFEVSDNCSSGLKILNSFDEVAVLLNCDSEFEIDVAFSAENICENTSKCNSTIKVYNELAPVVICDQNLEINCGEEEEEVLDLLLLRFEEINAFDEDISVIKYSSITGIENLQCGETMSVEFSVEDNCARTTDCYSIITVNDLTLPVITHCPKDIKVDFSKDNILLDLSEWKSEMHSTDNCSLTNHMSTIDDLSSEDFCDIDDLLVEFVAQDNCGNMSDPCLATLTVNHININPTCPSPLVLECGHNDNEALTTSWIENANTSSVSSSGYGLVTDFNLDMLTSGCSETTIINFELTDECNRQFSCQSSITLSDLLSPELTCPAALRIEAGQDNAQDSYEAWLASTVFEDNCSAVSLSYIDIGLEEMDCETPVAITFTATDACQNSTSCSSSVTIEVENLSCPTFIELSCDETLTEETILEELEYIRKEIMATRFDIDMSALDLSCTAELELSITFYKDGYCYEDASCMSLLKILPSKKETDQEISSQDSGLFFPNIISISSRDESNKSFVVFGTEGSYNIETVQIYDRWGSLIWESNSMELNNSNTGWYGMNTVQQKVAIGTYLYVTKIIDKAGFSKVYSGSISVI